MFYYYVALLKSPLQPLTYSYEQPLEVGTFVDIPLSQKVVQGVVLECVPKPEFECSQIVTVYPQIFLPSMLECAKFISEYYVCSLGEALALFVPYTQGMSDVQQDNPAMHLSLSKAQQEALEFIQEHPSSLLFGDTGSGKTEIYMALFHEMLEEHKQALFLLPEIGLTPQMQKRLKHHFGTRVAIWHSKITPKKKESILKGLQNGCISIIAGTRSALFLPYTNLGAIVVDEEHDESYKSGSRPRYNARDLALLFGQKIGCKVVLGSATPSLSSFQKVPHFRLKGTFFDSHTRVSYDESEQSISQVMVEAITKTLNASKQVVVFLPTRANFKYIMCKLCGAHVECPYCSVGMSVHHAIHALKCHYCNYTEAIPQVCPKCGHDEIIAQRLGTSEVAQKLQEHFPNHTVQQFDRDEVRTEKQLNEILHAFNEHSIDIMVGTQMLSKGHDYHNVSLAVILGVDSLLSMSDFRAREKTLALVKQIAGRSGRKGYGEVLIQTQNSAFFGAYLDDYESFMRDELTFRKGLYPPFKKMLRLMSAHVKEEKAKALIEEVARLSKQNSQIELVGFGRANISKIAGKFRYEALLRSDSSTALIRFAHSIKHLKIEADMDPLSFS